MVCKVEFSPSHHLSKMCSDACKDARRRQRCSSPKYLEAKRRRYSRNVAVEIARSQDRYSRLRDQIRDYDKEYSKKTRLDGRRSIVNIRRKCRDRGLPFDLTVEWYFSSSVCFWCGRLLSDDDRRRNPRGRQVDRYPNTSGGYTQDNCVLACRECNHARAGLVGFLDRTGAVLIFPETHPCIYKK
jgi:hypothetical protein